jgi:glucose-6-phosphate dehydrogenase assembly protein OpcA
MPATQYSLGQQVEIGNVQVELKRLWKQGEGAMTRASLINLAVYSEAAGSLEENTQIVARIAQNHACRAIVIGADPTSTESGVDAWINAHCHVSQSGKEQICSEQLSFHLQGPCTTLLTSIVFSHLDSDLPFYLWWQTELHDPMDPQLWAWVDRFIYDSSSWKNFDSQFRLVETAQAEAKQRLVLCDLNWTRLDKHRLAVAQFFDHPASHHHFAKMEQVRIEFAPGFKSTAILLVGWLGAQLNWRINEPAHNGSCRFLDANNRKIDVELHATGSLPVGKIVLKSSEIEFRVAPAQCGDLLEISRSGRNEKPIPQMLPAQAIDPVSLLSDELMRGGPHRIYLRALNCVRSLL